LHLLDEASEAIAELGSLNIGANEANATVDVIADAAGRDDPTRRVEGGHSADWEAVTFVHVRHRERDLDRFPGGGRRCRPG